MKKILSILICLIFTFCFISVNKVNAEVPNEDETYLYSSKDGTPKKVYHFGGGEVTIPKNFSVYEFEMRGVWVATVYNIAIGKQNGVTDKAIADYKAEFLTILDRMEEFGMNTLFFQIRPNNDAFYKSELNPWSEFLVGKGVDPGWDPLEWMIEETHKRGFDFQCWMNAYRVTTSSVLPDGDKMASSYSNTDLIKYKSQRISELADNNFAKLHPEYVVLGEYDTRLILNPSEIAVQDFIVDTLQEIIENYDIDGMHFDDYFYLNGYTSSDTVNTNFAGGQSYDPNLTGVDTLNDLGNYQEYLDGDPKYAHMERGYTLGEFRRENINVMMRKIRAMVDEYNTTNNDNVEFGSKPAAVWRSNSQFCSEGNYKCSPIGSDTHEGAYASYGNLFADTWKWVEEGLVDYVAPQVYYSFEDNIVPYADIVDWWVEMVENLNIERESQGLKPIKLYIAHGLYKYRDAPTQFYNPAEIRNQIVYNKKHPTIVGSAFYSYECLYEFSSDEHEKGVSYLKNNWVNNPVYPIPRGDDDSEGLKVTDYNIIYDVLAKTHTIITPKQVGSRVYGIYKVEKGTTFDSSDVSTRISVVYDPYVEGENAVLRIDDYDENYDYYVKVVSTNGHVSKESTKLEFTNVEEVESIKINHISSLPQEILTGAKVTFTASITNTTGNNLDYNVYYVQNGNVRKDRILASGKITSNVQDITFTTYSSTSNNNAICLEVTDGNVSTELISNTFDIVSKYTIPSINKVDNLFDKYTNNNHINATLHITNPLQTDYQYEAFLCYNDQEVSVVKGEVADTTIPLNINLDQINTTSAVLKIVLSSNNKSNTFSYYFELIEPVLNSTSITVNKTSVNVDDLITITGAISSEYSDIPYTINLVNENGELIESIVTSYIYEGVIDFAWTVEDINVVKFKIEVVINHDGIYSSWYSDIISLEIERKIMFNLNGGTLDSNSMTYIQGVGLSSLPTPTKDKATFVGWYLDDQLITSISPNETRDLILNAKWEEKSGCGCGKSIGEVSLLIMVQTAAILLIRKKH